VEEMNTKLLTEADGDLYEVEMATRRKQLAPLVKDLLSPEAKNDCAKLAMFDDLFDALEALYVAEKLDDGDYRLEIARRNAAKVLVSAHSLRVQS
jgi:citrate synthase